MGVQTGNSASRRCRMTLATSAARSRARNESFPLAMTTMEPWREHPDCHLRGAIERANPSLNANQPDLWLLGARGGATPRPRSYVPAEFAEARSRATRPARTSRCERRRPSPSRADGWRWAVRRRLRHVVRDMVWGRPSPHGAARPLLVPRHRLAAAQVPPSLSHRAVHEGGCDAASERDNRLTSMPVR